MLNRWVEDDASARHAGELGRRLDRVLAAGAGHADRSKYLGGIPADSRAAQRQVAASRIFINDETIANIKALNAIAERRGQTLAQMALAWVLRERPRDLGADRRQPARAGARIASARWPDWSSAKPSSTRSTNRRSKGDDRQPGIRRKPMTRVVVTGGSGKVGRACVKDLLEHGYEVFNVDIVAPAASRCPFVQARPRRFRPGFRRCCRKSTTVLANIDALVHLAGDPGAGQRTRTG